MLNEIGATFVGAGLAVSAVALFSGMFARRRGNQPPTKPFPVSLRIRIVALVFVFVGIVFELAARI